MQPAAPVRRQYRLLSLALIGLALLGSTHPARGEAPKPPPETVPHVDLDRYLGTWFEIAHIPNRFQKHCRSDTTAQYRRMENERIEVINRCINKHGRVDEARGVARVVDPVSNAKLEVSFVSLFGWRLFWGDYWILDLASDYSYALVGSPDYRYGWILSRTPTLPTDIRAGIDARLRESGYDPAAFRATPQERRPTLMGQSSPLRP